MDRVQHHQNYYKQTLMCNILVNARYLGKQARVKGNKLHGLFESTLSEILPTIAVRPALKVATQPSQPSWGTVSWGTVYMMRKRTYCRGGKGDDFNAGECHDQDVIKVMVVMRMRILIVIIIITVTMIRAKQYTNCTNCSYINYNRNDIK